MSLWTSLGRWRGTYPFKPLRHYHVLETFQVYETKFNDGDILLFMRAVDMIKDCETDYLFLDDAGNDRVLSLKMEATDEELDALLRKRFKLLPRG
jgi:hypothetical protein